MKISIQYLEGTRAREGISAAEARGRLRSAFERVQFEMVMLGWDLDPPIIEACAQECDRHGTDLYLWLPVLTGHGAFRPESDWKVIALDGRPAGSAEDALEFGFICPNRAEVLEGALQSLTDALEVGFFKGVFLDRIRLPSPSLGLERDLGCFCDGCRAAAERSGLDLEAARQALLGQFADREGRREAVACLVSQSGRSVNGGHGTLQPVLDFRSQSISSFVGSIAAALKAGGLKVGLDCFAPTLTRMVGQDLSQLARHADWIKVMTYARAFGRASLPYELLGLSNWLMAGGETEASALACLSESTGWPLPGLRDVIRRGGLPASILTEELRRGRSQVAGRLQAGIELLEIPDVSMLDRGQIRIDAQAVQAGEPDGVVLSWDLWHMPEWRLELAASLYGGG